MERGLYEGGGVTHRSWSHHEGLTGPCGGDWVIMAVQWDISPAVSPLHRGTASSFLLLMVRHSWSGWTSTPSCALRTHRVKRSQSHILTGFYFQEISPFRTRRSVVTFIWLVRGALMITRKKLHQSQRFSKRLNVHTKLSKLCQPPPHPHTHTPPARPWLTPLNADPFSRPFKAAPVGFCAAAVVPVRHRVVRRNAAAVFAAGQVPVFLGFFFQILRNFIKLFHFSPSFVG